LPANQFVFRTIVVGVGKRFAGPRRGPEPHMARSSPAKPFPVLALRPSGQRSSVTDLPVESLAQGTARPASGPREAGPAGIAGITVPPKLPRTSFGLSFTTRGRGGPRNSDTKRSTQFSGVPLAKTRSGKRKSWQRAIVTVRPGLADFPRGGKVDWRCSRRADGLPVRERTRSDSATDHRFGPRGGEECGQIPPRPRAEIPPWPVMLPNRNCITGKRPKVFAC